LVKTSWREGMLIK